MFALEGAANEIDLAPASVTELREALDPFMGPARKTDRGGRCSRVVADADRRAVRRACLVRRAG